MVIGCVIRANNSSSNLPALKSVSKFPKAAVSHSPVIICKMQGFIATVHKTGSTGVVSLRIEYGTTRTRTQQAYGNIRLAPNCNWFIFLTYLHIHVHSCVHNNMGASLGSQTVLIPCIGKIRCRLIHVLAKHLWTPRQCPAWVVGTIPVR